MIKHTFKTLWAAARYFTLGLAAAMLTAPQSGKESRGMVRDRIMALYDQTLPTTPHTPDHEDAAGLDKRAYWASGVAPSDYDGEEQAQGSDGQEHPVL